MGKKLRIQLATTYLVALICAGLASNSLAVCREEGVDLQILGSGGPLGRGNRASSGYLLWINGEARVMVDAGGGTFLRFHEAGATVETMDLLAISHLHPDHAAEIPALYWVHGFTTPIAGPSGSDQLPSITEFMQSLFQSDDAAFRVLETLRDTEVIEIDASGEFESVVLETNDYVIRAIGVPHGEVPALGFRIDIDDRSIAFASDQTGTNANFTQLIEDVDVLVAHLTIPETVQGRPAMLHARPSVWGAMAEEAKVSQLVLSHLGAILQGNREDPDNPASVLGPNWEVLRANYSGDITVGEDLLCVPL